MDYLTPEGMRVGNPCCWGSLLGLYAQMAWKLARRLLDSENWNDSRAGRAASRSGAEDAAAAWEGVAEQRQGVAEQRQGVVEGAGCSWEPAAPGASEEEAVCFGFCACVFAATPREDTAGSELTSLVNFLYSFWPFITLRSGGLFYF